MMLTIRKRGDYHVCELSPNGAGYSQTTMQAFEHEADAVAFLKDRQPDQPVAEKKAETPKPAKKAKKVKK